MDSFTGLPSGTVLDGRYRLGGLIARGGMSTVYRGVDLRLDRPVAVKIMSPQYVTDPTFLGRFEREARVAAGLGHSGVVAVFDQGRDGDLVFLVMELVDGGTLRDLLRERHTLSVPVTLSILEPLLDALAAAHAAGLVHRDVKPENVLLSAKGEVKIADFGLVRAVSSQTMATGDVILGTVAYLSPEQVATGASDARSDVYSAGIVAYEMLTGAPPYAGDNPMSVAYQHVHSDAPAPSRRAADIPVELDALIVAATRRDPAVRPRDAGAFLSAVAGTRSRLGLRRVPVPVPHRPTPAIPVTVPGTAAPRGPGGTAMMAVGGPLTVAERTPARIPASTPASTDSSVPQPVRTPSTDTTASMALRRRRRQRWAIAIVLLVVLGLVAAAGGWWLGGRWSSTPASVGLSQAAAEAAVRDAGLVPRVVVEHDDDVAPGLVAASVPAPGTEQLRGSEVELLISAGPGAVPVPTVAGKQREDAENKLRVDGFALGLAIPTFSPSAERGAVLGTRPAAGAVAAWGSPVSLLIADFATVPDVRGLPTAEAEKALRSAGFDVTVGDPAFDAEIDAGHVLRTDPGAGARVDKAAATAFVVPSNSVTVPDVTGLAVREARERLRGAGLQSSESIFFGDDAATVWSQSPEQGDRVAPGGTVQVSAFW